MSKKVEVAGQVYDSRTIVENTEKLKLPNHPKVNALVVPIKFGNKLTGKMNVIVKIPFGSLAMNMKEVHFVVLSPRRIDAINKVIEVVKSSPMYRRVTA